MQGAKLCFYFHQVKTFAIRSGTGVKLASEICPQFKILLKTKFFFFYYYSLFKFLLAPLFLIASVLKKEG